MADALASGASPGNRVEVRVLSSAPIQVRRVTNGFPVKSQRSSIQWWSGIGTAGYATLSAAPVLAHLDRWLFGRRASRPRRRPISASANQVVDYSLPWMRGVCECSRKSRCEASAYGRYSTRHDKTLLPAFSPAAVLLQRPRPCVFPGTAARLTARPSRHYDAPFFRNHPSLRVLSAAVQRSASHAKPPQ